MTSIVVFAIAFAVGCLSGIVLAIWTARRRPERRDPMPFWRMRRTESTAAQRILRR